MKANEMPEKLYISDSELNDAEHCVIWFKSQQNKNDIEYTRNDAFIEKALAYLNEKFYFNSLHYAVENNTFNCMEEMYEDFINYMKGE